MRQRDNESETVWLIWLVQALQQALNEEQQLAAVEDPEEKKVTNCTSHRSTEHRTAHRSTLQHNQTAHRTEHRSTTEQHTATKPHSTAAQPHSTAA